MNHNIVEEISKHVNIKNLLLTSKDFYNMKSKKMIERINHRHIKDYTYIESVHALKYLIHKVVNKNRFDLLVDFVRNTAYRILSLIISSCVIVQSKRLNVNDKIVKKILYILKCDSNELVLFYLLVKQHVSIYEFYRYLSYDSQVYLKKEIDKYEDFKVYNQNETEDLFISIDKYETDEIIKPLVNYRKYLYELIIYEKIDKDEEFFNEAIKVFEPINRKNNEIDSASIVKQILKKLEIEKIEGLLLFECFGYIKRHKRYKRYTLEKTLLQVLSRKFDFIDQELVDLLDKTYRSDTIVFGIYFEAYKYKNEKMIQSILNYLNKQKYSSVYAIEKQQINLSLNYNSKYIWHLDSTYLMYQAFRCYNKILNYYNFNFYREQVEHTFNILNSRLDRIETLENLFESYNNVYLFSILYNIYTNINSHVDNNLISNARHLERDLNINTNNTFKIDKEVVTDEFIKRLNNNIKLDIDSDRELIYKNIRYTCRVPISSIHFDLNYSMLRKDLEKYSKHIVEQATSYRFSYDSILVQYCIFTINYAVINSYFFLIDNKNIDWILVSPTSLILCKNLTKLYEIAGDEGTKTLKEIMKLNN